MAVMELELPAVRGKITRGKPLSGLTWLRVGGPAEVFFQPADVEDLAAFLRGLPGDIPVFPMGVGSNLIVRDGGLKGAGVRLGGRGCNAIEIENGQGTAGAAARDAMVARRAADAGIDLTFLRAIPGALGGAVRMNAGCYGTYIADVFCSAQAVTRQGEHLELSASDLGFAYRSSQLPPDTIITSVTLAGPAGDPDTLHARMAEQLARRDATQPTKELSAGSTFRNPAGFSSTGRADDVHDLKAWKVIDEAGLRGVQQGGAQISPMHANFLINTGGASAADLEGLGEEVRKRVFQDSGIELLWEIMRVGEKAAD